MDNYMIKILVAGEVSVGKTTICNLMSSQCIDDTDLDSIYNIQPTIGVEYFSYHIPEKNIKAQIWDLSGNKLYMNIYDQYFKNIDLVFLCFDRKNKTTLEGLNVWLDELKLANKDTKNYPGRIFLIGTDKKNYRKITCKK